MLDNYYNCLLLITQQLVLLLGGEWPDMGRLLKACVSATAQIVAADPSGSPELTEGLFALLYNVTKKKPLYIDWIDDVLPQLVELGESFSTF